MKSTRAKLIAAFFAAGISVQGAYVADDVTLPSEGLMLAPYMDPVGLKTFCVGHLAKKTDKVKSNYSEEECMAIFAKDWKEHLVLLDSVVKVPYKSEWERQALNDFTFNVGISNVKSSTLLKLVNKNKHEEACQQLTKWTKGKVKGILTILKGLVTRRDKTMPYCMGEIPYDKQKDYQEFVKEWNEYAKTQLN